MTDTATLFANLKFYAGEASCHPDPNYCLEFEKLCTPSNILTLLSQLEAERQRADAVCRDIRIQANDLKSAQTVNKVLQAELAALRGNHEK